MFVFLLDAVKTCDLPVTCKKTIAEASFLCGVEDRGKSSNPLTHATERMPEAFVYKGFRCFCVLRKLKSCCDLL